jgi:hypothetical protein
LIDWIGVGRGFNGVVAVRDCGSNAVMTGIARSPSGKPTDIKGKYK